MEPVSAIGLASAILTFVDFASTLVGGAVEIYRSVDGALNENARLGDVKDDLDGLAESLDMRCPRKTDAERRIARIAEDCRDDSRKLQKLLNEAAGSSNNRTMWKSLKASWMSIRSRKEIAELRPRMREYRSDAILQISLLLRDEQSSFSLRIAQIRDDCSQLKIAFRTEITTIRNEILGAISAFEKPDQEEETSVTSLANISKMLLAMQSEVDETQLHHRILRQLVFKDMNSRANQINKAAQGTYNWMLEDGPINKWDRRSHAWEMFPEWLRTGDSIFFVSGNPGSGKSTLMKFLIRHERTLEELAIWSGEDVLIFGVFYFWNSGSRAQRTLSGLYRSLLFQSLSQQLKLIEEVFPLQVRRMRASPGSTTVEEIQNFEEDQIEEAFNLLLDRASHGGYRLCFFIDGLDECEGNRLEHEELAMKLQKWTVSGKIKLCVSSRPYSELLEPLSIPANRLIQLHKLNEPDIRAYCINRFENDIQARKRAPLCGDLALTVVERAQGVFLWVYLVIDILLIGLRQADPDYVLRAQLQALPVDLDLLYNKLRAPIEADSIQRDRANRMLLLAAENPSEGNLTAMAFSWLEEQDHDQGGLMDPDFPPPSGTRRYSEEEICERIDRVTKQINGLARGFLEIGPRRGFLRQKEEIESFFASTVQFCHRSARDYLVHNKDRHSELLKSFPNFEKSEVYTKILLAEILHGYRLTAPSERDIFSVFDQSIRKDIDPDLAGKFALPFLGLPTSSSKYFPSSAWKSNEPPEYRYPCKISFTEYAAYCGLSRYVLREVTMDSTKLGETSSCGNVLLAAVMGMECELASELLRLSGGKKQLCEVCDYYGKRQTLVPTCVLAITVVLERITGVTWGRSLPSSDSKSLAEQHTALARELLRFIIDQQISLRVTIAGGEKATSKRASVRSKQLQVQIDAEEALKLLNSFKFEEIVVDGNLDVASRHSTPRGGFWRLFSASVLESMRVGRFGRVLDEWADTTNRLQEWSDEPHAYFSGGIKDKEEYVDKIEWAFENQDLAELKGWVILY